MLKTFLVLIIIYLLSRIFFRYIFPVIIRNLANKAAQGMQGQFNQHQEFQQHKRRPEGEVIIEEPSPNKKGPINRSGDDEFVDYTEVK